MTAPNGMEYLPQPFASVLAKLDPQNFNGLHLLVHELDNGSQFLGQYVGNEQQADPTRTDVLIDDLPKIFDPVSVQCRGIQIQ